MALADSAKAFVQANRFLVNFDGFTSDVEFTEVTGLEMSFDEVVLRTGGSRVPYKSPSNVNFGDITLRKGVTPQNSDFYVWAASQAQMTAAGVGAKAIGLGNDGFKRNGEISLLDNDGTELMKWSVNGAYVKSFKPGDLKADSNEALIEEIVIGVTFWDRAG